MSQEQNSRLAVTRRAANRRFYLAGKRAGLSAAALRQLSARIAAAAASVRGGSSLRAARAAVSRLTAGAFVAASKGSRQRHARASLAAELAGGAP